MKQKFKYAFATHVYPQSMLSVRFVSKLCDQTKSKKKKKKWETPTREERTNKLVKKRRKRTRGKRDTHISDTELNAIDASSIIFLLLNHTEEDKILFRIRF